MTNKEIVMEFIDKVFNAWDLTECDRFMREDYRQHSPEVKDGRDGFKEFAEHFFAVKPHMHVFKIAEDGDMVFGKLNQDHYCIKPKTIDEYIQLQDDKAHPKLYQIRGIIRAAIPDAEERISWSMPTFWKGRNIIHFAASKKHIGLYPGGEATAVFMDELKDLDVSKGTV